MVLALIAFAGYGWVNGTVIYLAGQSQVGYSVRFSVPARRRPGPGDQQATVTSRCGPDPAAGSWSAGT